LGVALDKLVSELLFQIDERLDFVIAEGVNNPDVVVCQCVILGHYSG
jgi:hypothetical protein